MSQLTGKRKCQRCGQRKPIGAFEKRYANTVRLMGWCASCRKGRYDAVAGPLTVRQATPEELARFGVATEGTVRTTR